MKIFAVLSPYYSLMAITAISSFLVCGALTNRVQNIKKTAGNDAVISFMIDQPLQQVTNFNVSKKEM